MRKLLLLFLSFLFAFTCVSCSNTIGGKVVDYVNYTGVQNEDGSYTLDTDINLKVWIEGVCLFTQIGEIQANVSFVCEEELIFFSKDEETWNIKSKSMMSSITSYPKQDEYKEFVFRSPVSQDVTIQYKIYSGERVVYSSERVISFADNVSNSNGKHYYSLSSSGDNPSKNTYYVDDTVTLQVYLAALGDFSKYKKVEASISFNSSNELVFEYKDEETWNADIMEGIVGIYYIPKEDELKTFKFTSSVPQEITVKLSIKADGQCFYNSEINIYFVSQQS